MTDTPTPSEHDPLADALRHARADVAPVSGDALVAAARGAKDARARSHRRATGGALGAVAALLLVAVAAVALNDRPSSQVLKAGAPMRDLGINDMSSAGKIAFGVVTVSPSTGLTDGQTVTVSARGFDAGTKVSFIECTPKSLAVVTPTSPQPMPGTTGGSVEPGGSSGASSASTAEESGWWCDGPPTRAGSRATVTAAHDAGPEVEDGHLTTATTTMRVVPRYDGFATNASPAGEFSSRNASPASAAGTCINPETIAPPSATDAPSAGSSASTSPSTGSGVGTDGTTSVAPDAGNTSSLEAFMGLFPGPKEGCVIIAVGTSGGRQTVYSSQPLSFGDAQTGPATTMPSPTSVPPTDPPSCPKAPAGTVCAPAVEPPSTTPSATACPNSLPVLGTTNTDHTQPLIDFTPTSITICHLPVAELGAPPVTVTNPATITRITTAIGALQEAPNAHTMCTMDISDSMVLVAKNESKRTVVIEAQFYGCGLVTNGVTDRGGAQSLRWIYNLTDAN